MSVVPFIVPKITIMLPTGDEVTVTHDAYPGVDEIHRPHAYYFCVTMGTEWSDSGYYLLDAKDAVKVAGFEDWAVNEVRRLLNADVVFIASLIRWLCETGSDCTAGHVTYKPFLENKPERLDSAVKNFHQDVQPSPRTFTMLNPNTTGFIPMSKMHAVMFQLKYGKITDDRR